MRSLLLAAVLALVLTPVLPADVIDAAPGEGTISAAAAKAKEGDRIRLAAGAYTTPWHSPAV